MANEVIIVNEKDKIVGYKPRELVIKKDIYRVSALWLEDTKDRVLLAKRSISKKHNPGKWGPATAGTVEKGETYKTNILKEVTEELGLQSLKVKKGRKERVKGKYNYFCQWYIAIVNAESMNFVIQENEVDQIKWFSKTKLKLLSKKSPDIFIDSSADWLLLFL